MAEEKQVNSFQDRLNFLVKKFGTAENLSKKSGVSAHNIGKYISGETSPGMDKLIKIAQAADVSIDWLATGEESPKETDFHKIPMAEAKLAAGGGSVVLSESFKEFYLFRKDWVNKISTNPKNLVLMFVVGDSMEKDIADGDMVMIDRGRIEIHTGQIYAIGAADTIMIKCLELLPDGKVKVISKNPQYSPYIIDNQTSPLRVIGQVIWFARELVKSV